VIGDGNDRAYLLIQRPHLIPAQFGELLMHQLRVQFHVIGNLRFYLLEIVGEKIIKFLVIFHYLL